MKQRNGFVSNSSSSSFIIQWKCHLINGNDGVEKALICLFDIYGFEDDVEGFAEKLDEYDAHLKPTLDLVIKKSKKMLGSENSFETEFYTGMRNDTTDYGKPAHELLLALTVNIVEKGKRDFEILHMRTEGND